MTFETWIALAAANFAAALAPGQNAALIGSATSRAGLVGGLAALGGILLAETIWAQVALHLALSVRELGDDAFRALQIGGACLLLWFGLTTLRDRSSGTTGSRASLRCALQGLWIGLANPLALVFFIAVFPAFVGAEGAAGGVATAMFFGSAILLSSAAGHLPFLGVAGVLARAGRARLLRAASGTGLLVMGALVLATLAR